MGRYDKKRLLKKLTQGTISSEELEYLNNWLAENGENGLADLMDKDWEQFDQSESLHSPPLWKGQAGSISRSKHLVSWKKSLSIAASILLLIGIGIVFLWLVPNNSPQFVTKINTDYRKELVELSDGSKVWLKRNSKLSYWQPFKEDQRVFELEGQAFFEVATDSSRPFIVHTDFLTARVLGTSFNIISGTKHLMPEVALVEGVVEVSYHRDSSNTNSAIRLNPGEKLKINPANQHFAATSFVKDEPYAWKNDVLLFKRADVYEVAEILENWYGVAFTVEVIDLAPTALGARYDTKKHGMEEVLKGISSVMPYKFQRQSNGSFMIVNRDLK